MSDENEKGIPANLTYLTDEAIRVLNEGDTFGIFNRWGDILTGNRQSHGLFYQDTRHLSGYRLLLFERTPVLLSSELEEDNEVLDIHLINLEQTPEDGVKTDQGDIYIHRSQQTGNGWFSDQLFIRNFGRTTMRVNVQLHLEADFRDIFEVRGFSREQRGTALPPETKGDTTTFRYTGLDDIERRTTVWTQPAAGENSDGKMIFTFDLGPGESQEIRIEVSMEHEDDPAREVSSPSAKPDLPGMHTSNEWFNHWLSRSHTDLMALFAQTESGHYPYAGIPWFNTAFGRDGILTALSVLWLAPRVARDVLKLLAANQAKEYDSFNEGEPGKIMHERRQGEMARLREVPFGLNYSSVDATPLFITLCGRYFRRTADHETLELLWPSVLKAMDWIVKKASENEHGFITYQQKNKKGLIHQGWKDANDAVSHADGSLAGGPVALCEVQAYTYSAFREAAYLASQLNEQTKADQWNVKARELHDAFNREFWDNGLGTYVLALDGKGIPCRVNTSNAGQCLAFGIVPEDRADAVGEKLFSENMYTGWGIRTLSREEKRYSPLAYHNGTVWPHDNALIAKGLSAYGRTRQANILLHSLFEAALHFEDQRLPELFCGFNRTDRHGPVPYPVACSPQAWSVASIYLMLNASLRISIDAPSRTILFCRPELPEFIDRLIVEELPLPNNETISLEILKYPNNTGVNILESAPDWKISVEK